MRRDSRTRGENLSHFQTLGVPEVPRRLLTPQISEKTLKGRVNFGRSIVPLVINSGGSASLVANGGYQLDGFALQVSIKTPHGTLVNVRGDDATEFDMNLSHALEKVEQIHAAEAAYLGLSPKTTEEGVALLQTAFPGSTVISDTTAPPPWEQPAPPVSAGWPPASPPQGYQQTHCDRCKQAPVCKTCQRPCNLFPKSVKDGQWHVHDCPSGDRSHKGAWCNLPK